MTDRDNLLIEYMFHAGWQIASNHPLYVSGPRADYNAWLGLGFDEKTKDDDWYHLEHFNNPCKFGWALRWQIEKDGI